MNTNKTMTSTKHSLVPDIEQEVHLCSLLCALDAACKAIRPKVDVHPTCLLHGPEQMYHSLVASRSVCGSMRLAETRAVPSHLVSPQSTRLRRPVTAGNVNLQTWACGALAGLCANHPANQAGLHAPGHADARFGARFVDRRAAGRLVPVSILSGRCWEPPDVAIGNLLALGLGLSASSWPQSACIVFGRSRTESTS